MKHLLFLGITFAAFHSSLSIPDFCRLPEDEGEGLSFTFALYYNASMDQCYPFLYKGQGGNANRFLNERECIRNCSVNADELYPMDATKACHFKKAQGGCSGRFLRYYYDSVHDKCKKFLWSGCLGNGNRFFDFNSCNTTCAGIHDDGSEEEEEDEPDTPIAIICGVLLGAIVASIFITVIVLTVKSKKKASKKKAGGRSKEAKSEAPLQEQAIEMS